MGAKLKYIITSMPRSGTRYLAELLTSAGLPCGHEKIFGLQLYLQDRGFVAESSWLAPVYLRRYDYYRDVKIIHLLRNPINVIRGLLFDFDNVCSAIGSCKSDSKRTRYDRLISEEIPNIAKLTSPIDKALYFYLEWNTGIEKLNPTHRINVEIGAEEILKIIGVKHDGLVLFSNQKHNTLKRCLLSREEIITILRTSCYFDQFKDKITTYGYSI